jgi:hypothetical protein
VSAPALCSALRGRWGSRIVVERHVVDPANRSGEGVPPAGIRAPAEEQGLLFRSAAHHGDLRKAGGGGLTSASRRLPVAGGDSGAEADFDVHDERG